MNFLDLYFVYASLILNLYNLISDDEEGSEILQHAGNFLSKRSEYLPRGLIDIGKVKDANCSNKFDVSGFFVIS